MVTVLFTCKTCGLSKQQVQVPARDTLDSDVAEWVKRTAELVGEMHHMLRPQCPCVVVDLMIPCPPESEFIGQQIE